MTNEIIELAEEFALRKERVTDDDLVLDVYFDTVNVRLRSEVEWYNKGINNLTKAGIQGVRLYPALVPCENEKYRKEAIVRFMFPKSSITYDDAKEYFQNVDHFIMEFHETLNDREVDSLDEKAIHMLNKEYDYGSNIYPLEVKEILYDILNRTEE